MNLKWVLGIAVFVVGVSTLAVTVYTLWTGTSQLLGVANLIILAITVIALLVYAYDTHTIATVSKKQWERSSILGATYEMQPIQTDSGDVRTMFRLHNPSTLLVKAKVRCNFWIYGEPVDSNPDFNGENTWYAFPQQISQGWFDIGPLLAKKGKTIQTIIGEKKPENRAHQLTMDLEIYFRDEEGNNRSLPLRQHFFDFADTLWIPHLTQRDEWKLD